MNKYEETIRRIECEMMDSGLFLVPAKTIAGLVARVDMLYDRLDAQELSQKGNKQI
jgi:hypothetical protein